MSEELHYQPNSKILILTIYTLCKKIWKYRQLYYLGHSWLQINAQNKRLFALASSSSSRASELKINEETKEHETTSPI